MIKINKILEHKKLTSTQKIILVVLLVIPEDSSMSFNEIAFYTSVTRQTIITNLNKLEEIGLLEVTRNSTNTNSYKILI
ncbi:MarR family transcriptional regulator [Amphibacillus indicireducens]|uniref:HTH marR-type domain-containing protein n=1 Tax=Amphibacillus indicireducens TaxID=1076330 RepID=A0ABP7V0J2_9BACI